MPRYQGASVSFSMSGYGGGPVMVPASATAARALMSSAATGTGSPLAGAGCVPGGRKAGAGQHAEPERERLGARVQGGMTQLLVAGVQHAAGGTVLAGIQACAWFSSRVARCWEQGQGRVILLSCGGGQVSGLPVSAGHRKRFGLSCWVRAAWLRACATMLLTLDRCRVLRAGGRVKGRVAPAWRRRRRP